MTVLPQSSRNGRALRLLLAHEDAAVRAQLYEQLIKRGYQVDVAKDSAEMLRILELDDTLELAVLNWNILDTGTWCQIRRQKERRNLYVIVLLGWNERRTRETALELGADDCVYKLTDMEELHLRVRLGSQAILERALRSVEERFRIAFEQSAIATAMINVSDGRFAHVNQALSDFLGYSEEELITKDIMSVSHPGNVPTSQVLIARLASGECNGEQLERRYVRKDGRLVWGLVSLSLVRDEAGGCAYAYAQFKDVTKRKEAEDAQQRAEVFSHAIMDSIDDLVMVVDGDRKWYYASPSHLAGLGYAPRELIGKDVFCTLHPDDQPLVETAIKEVFRTGHAPIISVRRLHKNGTAIHFEARGTLARGLCGGEDGTVVVSRAIEGRLRAEAKLQEASAETELFLRSIPSILIGLDGEGRIMRWNHSASEVFHLASEAVLGLPIDNCGIKWLDPEMGLEVCRWLQSKASYRSDYLAYEVNGVRRYIGLTVRRIEETSQTVRFIITGVDVTERKALEEQLRQAQKLEAIGQLAAGVAHEINTPTQYVGDNTRFLKDSWQGIAKLLQLGQSIRQQAESGAIAAELREKFDNAVTECELEYLLCEVPRAIEQSLDGVQRVAKIVKAMKDFSHPGSQEMKAVDLNKAIESTVAVARHEWKYVATVVTDFQRDLPLVPCLIGEFNQVVLNLIINAAHAIAPAVGEGLQEKGTITIRTRRCENWAEIAVQDSGTGIPEDLRSRIFEPFFTTKPLGQGTGQGLALAHSVIVKRHQGKIWFDTELGLGTTFFIRLPLQLSEKVS